MENMEWRIGWSFAGFPLAGMASALVTICLRPHLLHHRDPLGSGAFGVLMAASFWIFLGLRSIWRTAAFIAASIAAAYLAALSAILATGRLFQPGPPYEPAAFVGGLVGAFAILVTALFLLSPRPGVRPVLIKAAFWSLAGGLLGVAGQACGDLFGRIRPRLVFVPAQEPNSDISLILVWQTGMGFVIAMVLWIENRRLRLGTPAQSRL